MPGGMGAGRGGGGGSRPQLGARHHVKVTKVSKDGMSRSGREHWQSRRQGHGEGGRRGVGAWSPSCHRAGVVG